MQKAQAYAKLQRLAKQSLANIKQNIIVKERDHYLAFDRFKITKTTDGFAVHRYNDLEHTFINSQNAISYCVFDRNARQDHSLQLIHLDKKIQHKMFDLEVAKHTMTKTKDQERLVTASIRAQDYILEIKNLKEQINHLVNLAKYFQEKEQDNEVNRHRTKDRR
jgi:hypothetical protein